MDDTETNDEKTNGEGHFHLKKYIYIYIEPKFTEKKIQLCKVLIWEAVQLHFAMIIVYYLSKYKFKAENDFIYIPYSHLMYKE